MLGLRWKGKKNFDVAYKPINILLLLDWVKHPDEYDVTWFFVINNLFWKRVPPLSQDVKVWLIQQLTSKFMINEIIADLVLKLSSPILIIWNRIWTFNSIVLFTLLLLNFSTKVSLSYHPWPPPQFVILGCKNQNSSSVLLTTFHENSRVRK